MGCYNLEGQLEKLEIMKKRTTIQSSSYRIGFRKSLHFLKSLGLVVLDTQIGQVYNDRPVMP